MTNGAGAIGPRFLSAAAKIGLCKEGENSMALNYEEVRAFVQQNGDVTAYTASGRATPLRDDEPDAAAMVELWADIFEFGGKRYSRVEFERLIGGTRKPN